MNQIALDEPRKNDDPYCTDVAKMAERELAAFFSAVTELFGAEQAKLAAKNWLQELNAASNLPVTVREWRLITIEAARQLATQLNPSFQEN